jgi:hypothetical protein
MNFSDPSLIALAVLAAQFVGKAIPDSATGFLGIVRKVAKVVGIYVSNQK